MSRRSSSGTTLAIIAAVLLASSLSGLVYALATSSANDPDDPSNWDDSAATIRDWCDNVQAYVGPTHAARSFTMLTRSAIAGDLKRPADEPPTSPAKDLDAWQARHELFVTSQYLQALEGYPHETALDEGLLKLGLGQAKRGARIDSSLLAGAGRSLDAYERHRC
ncbi:hypothetical protein [Aquihabitans sp. McL0605]|uniref:hypothetical protein n=1 Tax=Aquihabitans sp. McL0605 TaxID=3415671 RepID=UPI003CEB66BB